MISDVFINKSFIFVVGLKRQWKIAFTVLLFKYIEILVIHIFQQSDIKGIYSDTCFVKYASFIYCDTIK